MNHPGILSNVYYVWSKTSFPLRVSKYFYTIAFGQAPSRVPYWLHFTQLITNSSAKIQICNCEVKSKDPIAQVFPSWSNAEPITVPVVRMPTLPWPSPRIPRWPPLSVSRDTYPSKGWNLWPRWKPWPGHVRWGSAPCQRVEACFVWQAGTEAACGRVVCMAVGATKVQPKTSKDACNPTWDRPMMMMCVGPGDDGRKAHWAMQEPATHLLSKCQSPTLLYRTSPVINEME